MSTSADTTGPIVCPIISTPAELAARDPLEPAWMRIHPTFIVGTFHVHRHLHRAGKFGRLCRGLEVFYAGLEELLLHPEAPETRLLLEGLLEATLASQALLAEGPGLPKLAGGGGGDSRRRGAGRDRQPPYPTEK